MKSEMFDKIVKARAEERVEKKVKHFREVCLKAAIDLAPNERYADNSSAFSPLLRAIFAVLASDNHRKNWPNKLWAMEETAVKDELLAIMDEMQRALLAASNPTEKENEPASELAEPEAGI